MKIAMIGARGIANRYSGIETHLEELCPRLVDMGHDVTVFARSYFTQASEYQGVKIRRLPTIRTKHLDTLVHTLLATAVASGGEFDIVHFHALGPSVFAVMPRAIGKKAVATVHGLDWKAHKWGKFASWCLRRGEYASAVFPSATIVVSKTLHSYYHSRYPSSSVHYIPNGVPVPQRVSAQKIKELGLEENKYILFVGRLTPEKGCHVLVEAYKSLSTDLKLVVAGGSAHTGDYIRSLHQTGDGNVLFLGTVQQDLLAELYSNAYLFVLPSFLEGLPICLLEAMGHGLCSVASDIPANVEVIGQHGLIFPCGDSVTLASVIEQAIDNPVAVNELGSLARERIRRDYDWDDIVEKTASVYASVVRQASLHESLPERDRFNAA